MIVNIIVPNITESSFIIVAHSVLRDMAERGNIPANALENELNEIHHLTSSLSSSSAQGSIPVPMQNSINMTEDGHRLGNNILLAIETPLPRDISCIDNEIHPNAQHNILETRMPREDPEQLPQMPANWHIQGVPFVSQEAGSWVPQSNEEYIEVINTPGVSFSFSVEDLQWLDSVQ